MNKRDFFSLKRPQKSEVRSIGYFLEFSALLTSAIVISGYIYAQVRSASLGIRGLPIFGVDDYINYGTDPVNFMGTVVIVLYLLNSFRPEGRIYRLKKFVPINYLRGAALKFPFMLFFSMLGYVYIIIRIDGEFKNWINVAIYVFSAAFIITVYAVFSEIIDKHLIITISSKNLVILSIVILGLIGLLRGILDNQLPRNSDEMKLTMLDGLKLDEGFKLVLVTKSHFVFGNTEGEIQLIRSDSMRSITFKPSIRDLDY